MRLNLNFFSPLPPARTEIAWNAAGVLPALARLANVTVWTDQAEWDPTLALHAEVRTFSMERIPWNELNRADISVYHLGNNVDFHESIYRLCRMSPGVVIVHDLVIQHLVAGFYLHRRRDLQKYRAHVQRYYGPLGVYAANAFWKGKLSTEYMAEHFSMIQLAVEKAAGAIVHTNDALAAIRGQFPIPVALAPLSYGVRGPRRVPAERPSWEPRRLIIFGHLSPNRRIETTLRALHSHPLRDHFRLNIYGQLAYEDPIRALITNLQLDDIVTLHGFVPAEELEAALTSADLAINLRYPTMGEASASQLKIWEYSLPSLVTRIGWYAALPADCVCFVDIENEVADVQRHLDALWHDPERFRRMGENGRRVLETVHTPDGYAHTLVQLAHEAIRFRAPAAALKMVERVAPELAAFRLGSMTGSVLNSTARELRYLTTPLSDSAGAVP
jgi:glycosyltransferase involved in cell wall biosynthesis